MNLLNVCLIGLISSGLLLIYELRSEASSVRGARWRTVSWIGLAIAFGLGLYSTHGPQAAQEFFAGYLLEYALSVDNLFVFLLIFRAFNLLPHQQHRVLFWGLFGAVLLRGTFIFVGLEIAEHFQALFIGFGALLIFSSIKIARESLKGSSKEESRDEASLKMASPWLVWVERHLPFARADQVDPHSTRFRVKIGSSYRWTRLFLVLILVEVTDLAFAVDSIPAVFGVTHDRLIVLSSNLLAILGLRTLFLVLAHALENLKTLPYALSGILAFVGLKMMIEPWVSIPIEASLGAILAMLLLAMVAHLFAPKER